MRLWFLLSGLRLRDVGRMTLVGLYYGAVLPGQVAGDLVKAYRLSFGQSAPGEAAAATFVDRVVATLALLLIGAFAAPFVSGVPVGLALGLALAAGTLVAGAGIALHPGPRTAILARLAALPSARLRELLARFGGGLELVIRRPAGLLASFVVALAFHATCVAIHVALGPSLGIQLPVAEWSIAYAGVSMLMLLPMTLAGLGLREGGYVGLLGLFGATAASALSLSLVLFAFVLLGAVLGLVAELTAPGCARGTRRDPLRPGA